MTLLHRRKFLIGMLAAPAIVHAGNLMPIKALANSLAASPDRGVWLWSNLNNLPDPPRGHMWFADYEWSAAEGRYAPTGKCRIREVQLPQWYRDARFKAGYDRCMPRWVLDNDVSASNNCDINTTLPVHQSGHSLSPL